MYSSIEVETSRPVQRRGSLIRPASQGTVMRARTVLYNSGSKFTGMSVSNDVFGDRSAGSSASMTQYSV